MSEELLKLWETLNQTQKDHFLKLMRAYDLEKSYILYNNSFFNERFCNALGDKIIIHHSNSNRPLTKTLFEHAFNDALIESGSESILAESRTNPGHDITINGIRASLKTEAAKNIKDKFIHVSKWMELGKGEWILQDLLDRFISHLKNYEKIFTLRFISITGNKFKYQLVEIPKALLLESTFAKLEIMENSKQTPKPGYGYVTDSNGIEKFSLYFDGGTERKLQIKHLRIELCVIHAEWIYTLPS